MDITGLALLLNSKAVSLFLGAGSSIAAGGPNGENLLNGVRLQFKQPMKDSFFSTMQKIIGNNNGNRAEAENFIRLSLNSIGVTDSHKFLFSLPWRAVLTTNYDELPELVGVTLDKKRRIKGIITARDDVNTERSDDTLYCFKLFGDASIKYPADGSMVLTERDRRQAYATQHSMFQKFFELSTTGSIIYIGYSFRDELVFDIISDLKRTAGGLPWRGYAIMRNRPDSDTEQNFRDANIEWVEGSLEQFISECRRIHTDQPISSSVQPVNLNVHGVMIGLDKETQLNIRESYHLLNQSDFGCDTAAIDFLMGRDTTFEPIRRGWDYPRRLKCPVTEQAGYTILTPEEFVRDRQDKDVNDNTVFALIGVAGAGKTVAARRISHEWYKAGNPVILVKDASKLDRLALAHLLDRIREEYLKSFSSDVDRAKPLRYLLIAENCKAYHEAIISLITHLKSIIKPVDILLVERSSALSHQRAKSLGISTVIELDDTVSREESTMFFEHFNNLQVLHDKYTLTSNLENSEINSSFFALIYSSVKGVQESLRISLLKEYQDMDATDKTIYSIASVFRAFGEPCYLSLLHRITGLDIQFIRSRAEANLLSVLKYDKGSDALIVNQRLVAEIIVDIAYQSNADLKRILIEIIRVINPFVINHINLLHDLVVSKIAIENRFRKLQHSEYEEIFESAIKVMRSGILLHHYAKLQLGAKKLDKCRDLLSNCTRTAEPSYRAKDHYVKDTQARLEIEESRNASKEKNFDKAREHLINAESLYKSVFDDQLATSYHYQGLATTYLQFALISPDPDTRTSFLLNALSTCMISKYVSGDDQQDIVTLINRILVELSPLGFNIDKAREIARTNGNSEGFAFLARKAYQEEGVSTALTIVNEGLLWNKSSEWLNQLRIAYFKELFPADTKKLGEKLLEWEANSGLTKPLGLIFEMAKYKFATGRAGEAMQLFRELRFKTRDEPARHSFNIESDSWLEKGEPRVFYGIISRTPRKDDWGRIKVTSEPSINIELPAPRQGLRYDDCNLGEDVSFNIIFNLLGPQATNIMRR